jgi:hypothetical protein
LWFLAMTICLSIDAPFVSKLAAEDDATWPGRASKTQLREQGFVPLFEGQSLEKWDVKPWHEGHWVVRDRVIDYDGKAEHRRPIENSLWTKDSYGDVVLYAEWRLPRKPRIAPQPIVLFNGDFLLDDDGKRITRPRLDAGDSGILLRGILKCQANIWSQELGSGEVNGYRTDRRMPPEVRRACIPLRRADRPAGKWNSFLISLQGSRMTVRLNGDPVIDVVLPDLPSSGPIGLQHHGDPVQFRTIWVKETE